MSTKDQQQPDRGAEYRAARPATPPDVMTDPAELLNVGDQPGTFVDAVELLQQHVAGRSLSQLDPTDAARERPSSERQDHDPRGTRP